MHAYKPSCKGQCSCMQAWLFVLEPSAHPGRGSDCLEMVQEQLCQAFCGGAAPWGLWTGVEDVTAACMYAAP